MYVFMGKNNPKSKKGNKKNKALVVIGISALVVIVVVAFVLFFAIKGTAGKVAVLNIETGIVEYKRGNTNFIAAEDGMSLKQKDSIKTQDDGKANIILFESVIIQIDENTELSLEKLIKNNISVKQTKGTTWNKFLGIMGINSYSVETPNTVATVRGTGFLINVSDKKTRIIVGEGTVTVSDNTGDTQKVTVYKQAIKDDAGKILVTNTTKSQNEIIRQKIMQEITIIKKIRAEKILRNTLGMAVLSAYNVTKDNLENYLEKVDNGNINLSKIKEKSPIKGGVLDELDKLTSEIKRTENQIKDINAGIIKRTTDNSLVTDPAVKDSTATIVK